MDQISLLKDDLEDVMARAIVDVTGITKDRGQEDFIPVIISLYEGYGYMAENFEELSAQVKVCKKYMQEYIIDIDLAKNRLFEIHCSASKAMKAAALLAAVCHRIELEVNNHEDATQEDVETFRQKREAAFCRKEAQ